MTLGPHVQRGDREALGGRVEPADRQQLLACPVDYRSAPSDLARTQPVALHDQLVAAAAAPLGEDAVADGSGPAHQHLAGTGRGPPDQLVALGRVPSLVAVQQHAEREPSEDPDAAEGSQGVLQHHQGCPGAPDPLSVEPLRVAAESLPHRVGGGGNVEVGDQQGAPVEPPSGLPRVGLGLVGEFRHGPHAHLAEDPAGPLRGPGQAERIVGAARCLHPRLQRALHAVAALGDVLEGPLRHVGRPTVHHRRLRGAEIAGAGHLHQAVHEGREVEADMGRADQVRPVLAQAGKAVGLQHVQIVVGVHAHVDAGTVVQAQRRERAHRDLLGPLGQVIGDGRRAHGLDLPAAAAGLVLVGVDLGTVAEAQHHRRERLGRAVAEEPDVDLAALDILLGQHGLGEPVEDDPGRLAQFVLVVDHGQAERHRLVLGLDHHRVGKVADGGVGSLQHRELRGGEVVLAQDHLGDDLVQRQRMAQRPGGDVGDPDHLEDARHVGVAGLALKAVGDVEDHSGPLARDHAGHEGLELRDQLLVGLHGGDLVAAAAQRLGEPADGGQADLLLVGHAEQVDDVLAVPVVDDGDPHVAGIYTDGSAARIAAGGG